MATYITLIRYTQQGIQNMKESPARLDKAKEAIKAAGGELKTFYLTMGQYDAVVISEAPSDEVYMTTISGKGGDGIVIVSNVESVLNIASKKSGTEAL